MHWCKSVLSLAYQMQKNEDRVYVNYQNAFAIAA